MTTFAGAAFFTGAAFFVTGATFVTAAAAFTGAAFFTAAFAGAAFFTAAFTGAAFFTAAFTGAAFFTAAFTGAAFFTATGFFAGTGFIELDLAAAARDPAFAAAALGATAFVRFRALWGESPERAATPVRPRVLVGVLLSLDAATTALPLILHAGRAALPRTGTRGPDYGLQRRPTIRAEAPVCQRRAASTSPPVLGTVTAATTRTSRTRTIHDERAGDGVSPAVGSGSEITSEHRKKATKPYQ